MPCNCGKNKQRIPWQPRSKRAAAPQAEDAPEPAGRVITTRERNRELRNGARPPRAKQPTG